VPYCVPFRQAPESSRRALTPSTFVDARLDDPVRALVSRLPLPAAATGVPPIAADLLGG